MDFDKFVGDPDLPVGLRPPALNRGDPALVDKGYALIALLFVFYA